jgi:hypothetical protein
MTRYPCAPHRRPTVVTACFAASFSVFCSQLTLAQEADPVTIDARRCIGIESPAERLACFEAQVDDALDEGQNQTDSPAAPVAAAAAAPASSQSAPPKVVEVQGDRAAPSENESVGTIAALRERAPNQYLITLDNGQVWQQRFGQRYPLRVGQRVRIYDSTFGSDQRLQVDGVNGFIQVDRVQ